MKPRIAGVASLLVLVASSAWAAKPIYVAVGESKMVTVSQEIRTAESSNPEALRVEKRAHGAVMIEGVALGKSEVRLTTRDGDRIDLVVHVVSDGSSVYSMRAP